MSKSIFDHTNHEIYIISCNYNNKRYGFIATWVIPLSLEKKRRFAIAVSPFNSSYQPLKNSKYLGIQMLAQGDEHLVYPFGCTASSQIDKYANIHCLTNKIPFFRGGIGHVEAQIETFIPLKERTIFVANTKKSYLNPNNNKPPLTMNYVKKNLPEKIIKKLLAKKAQLADLTKKQQSLFSQLKN